MHQIVQLFIGSKAVILIVTIFKYSLHKFRETTENEPHLHWKCQLIQARCSIIVYSSLETDDQRLSWTSVFRKKFDVSTV